MLSFNRAIALIFWYENFVQELAIATSYSYIYHDKQDKHFID
ncbi:hypothetical protein [Okeania sp. SIO3B5]|nr:hypothetical protein [Okeania sp. SIO3B5]